MGSVSTSEPILLELPSVETLKNCDNAALTNQETFEIDGPESKLRMLNFDHSQQNEPNLLELASALKNCDNAVCAKQETFEIDGPEHKLHVLAFDQYQQNEPIMSVKQKIKHIMNKKSNHYLLIILQSSRQRMKL